MARQEESLEAMYAKLVIDEEDNEEIVVANTEIVEQKQSYVLIGRFLTEKNINFNAMQNVMATLWRPREGMQVQDIGGMRYAFTFFHKMDIQKVIEGGPWAFEQATLMLHQLEMGEDPCNVKMQEVEMWVQVYDIPRGFLSEAIMRSIGASLGKFVKVESGTFDGVWEPYVRVRVAINVDKPLKRRMKIRREGDNWSWINFKYERLGTFCFVCGMLGHSDRDCIIVYKNPDKVVERAYGVWLRAPSKNASKFNTGAKWLRNMHDMNSPASTMSGHGTSANMEHEGSQAFGKFMEVDGVVRVIHGESGRIEIKSRETRMHDKGELISQTDQQNQLSINQGTDNMERDAVVVDLKRKRVEQMLDGNQEGIVENLNQTDGSKNGQMAGPVVQARLGL